MEDSEREHFLRRLAESEKARRRWRGFALVMTPLLAVLLVLALVNVVGLSLTLREVVKREQAQRERAERAELSARRQLYTAQMARAQAAQRAEEEALKALSQPP